MNRITVKINELKFDIRRNASEKTAPIFLFLHGFKSFRNWGFIPYVCEKVAESGNISINLDFSHNGIISENPIHFDVEEFAKNTVSQEIEDVDAFISLLNNPSLWNEDLKNGLESWDGKIILCGHSRGAGVGIVTATKHILVERLILLAPVSDFNRYTPRMINSWIDRGFMEFNDPSSGQKLKVDAEYIKDLLDNSNKYDLTKVMHVLDLPTLIIHGDNDLSTSLREGKELFENYQKNKENKRNPCNFVIIKKANHLFNSFHPFKESNQYLDEVIDNIKDFIVYE